jgi:TfoX/Sxy family transcriptional regulator of competence genes
MASDQKFVEYVLDQIGDAGDVFFRKMFGEYALYCDNKVVALICDNQLFVKQTDAGRDFIGLENVVEAPAYPGAKNSFLIDGQIDDRSWMMELIRVTAAALPVPKPKKKK